MIAVPKNGKDRVYTPEILVNSCLDFLATLGVFNKSKVVLEPASGLGAFTSKLRLLGKQVLECEIDEGVDFFDFNEQVDFIITNPPWSLTRKFLNHSMDLTDNIAFLIPVNHIIGLKARMRDMRQKGFWVAKIKLLDTPKEFPQSGVQLGLCVIQKTQVLETVFY